MTYNVTPTQPFHTERDPDLGPIIDDFMAELDKLLKEQRDRTPRHH